MRESDLPEGASPLNWDVDFIIGAVKTRAGLSNVYTYQQNTITSYVQSVLIDQVFAGGVPRTLTFTSANTAGNTIIVYLADANNTLALWTISDSQNNVYTQVGSYVDDAPSLRRTAVFVAQNIAGGSNVVSASKNISGSNGTSVVVAEYTGTPTVSPITGFSGISSPNSSSISVSVTSTQKNQMLALFMYQSVQSIVTPPAGFTLHQSVNGGNSVGDGIAYWDSALANPLTSGVYTISNLSSSVEILWGVALTGGNSAPNPALNFNYIKSFESTDGDIETLALDSSGVMWHEDVNNNPGILSSIYTTIAPNTFAQSTTINSREYLALSNLSNGTDMPRQWSGVWMDRISQVGPGAAPTFTTASAGTSINSITQRSATTVSSPYEIIWFGGSEPNTGTTLALLIKDYEPFPSYLKAGDNVVLTGLPTINGYNPNNSVGTNPAYYTIVRMGDGSTVAGSPNRLLFWVTVPQTGYINISVNTPFTYVSTQATLNAASQVPNLQIGNQFTVTGGSVPSYDNTWLVNATPNASQLQITNTSLTGNIATYAYNVITGSTPVAGQLVTIVSTLNGNGIFNVTNASISSVSPGTFSLALPGTNTASAAENGTGIIYGNTFQFDAFAIFGNSTGGQIVTAGSVATGVRKACVSFLTRNGAVTQASPVVSFNVVIGASTVAASNIPIGPSNTVARIINFTGANGGNFFNIPVPVSVISNGVTTIESSTWINDNTTTSAVFSFSDATLLAAAAVDIQGNNLFAQKELGSCVGLIPYASRLFAIGEQNKVTNLLNCSFDGGIGTIPVSVGSTGTPVSYPLGWTVVPFSTIAAPAYIQSTFHNSSSSLTTAATYNSSNTAGNFLVATVHMYNNGGGPGTVTVTDNNGNVWSQAGAYQYGTFGNESIWYAPNCNAGPNTVTVTATTNGGNNYPSMTILEYSNMATVSLVDGQSHNTGGGTATSSGNVTTSQYDLLVGLETNVTAFTTYITGPGWTLRENGSGVVVDQIGPTGTYNFTGTESSGVTWGAFLVAFKSNIVPSVIVSGSVTTSPLFGNSYYIKNSTTLTQPVIGMITQPAFQDEYKVPILLPATNYSVRVTASCPSGISGSGVLVVDLYRPSANTILGSFPVTLGSMTANMATYTGALLTTTLNFPFTIVPSDLVLRVYGQNLPIGGDVQIDRIEVFPTEQPVLSTQLTASYANNLEAFDVVTGVIDMAVQNQQPITNAFTLFDNLYALKSNSLFETQDNGTTEPLNWDVKETSNKVGCSGINAMDYGEEWAVWAHRSGVYVFFGGEPKKISQEIQPVWDLINWSAGQTIWVKNDILNRRLLVGVPLKTPNTWLPFAPVNNSPVTPNVILMMSYREINSVQDLVVENPIHVTYANRIVAKDISRKWSIWQIASPNSNFIKRQDGNAPIFLGNGQANGKIYQFLDTNLSDDGVAINGLYTTFGLVKQDFAQGLNLGQHRKSYTYMSMTITGAGNLLISCLPDSLKTPYQDDLPVIALTDPASDNVELPLNEEATRLFVQYSTNAIGSWFNLQEVTTTLGISPWSPIRGSS